jgi:hypothetical protein
MIKDDHDPLACHATPIRPELFAEVASRVMHTLAERTSS